jgi:hypothetical protein
MSTKELGLTSLETQALELTQEAINFRGAMRNIGDKLKAYSESFQSFIKNQFIEDVPQIGLINDSLAKSLAKNDQYMNLRRRKVIVPPGLKVSYLDHLKTLHESQANVDRLIPEILAPTEKFLGTLLARPDTLKSRREPEVVQNALDHDVDALKSKLAKDFDKGRHETVNYGDLIGRQSDWPKIAESFNNLSDRLGHIDRVEVLHYVTTISEHLERLIEHLSDDSQAYVENGITISNLAKVSYAVANEVEFYATHAYMVELLQTSIENAVEVVNNG